MSQEWRNRWKKGDIAYSSLPKLDHLTREDWQKIYEPSDDTYLFVDTIKSLGEHLREIFPGSHGVMIVEVGSGSGTLSASLTEELKNVGAYTISTDCNVHACLATKLTMENNSLSSKGDSVNCDLVTTLRPGIFDILIFNPPYVPTSREEVGGVDITAAWAGGMNGREVLDRLISNLNFFMRDRSALLILAVEENKPDDIVQILETEMGFRCCCVSKRRALNERLLIILGVRGIEVSW